MMQTWQRTPPLCPYYRALNSSGSQGPVSSTAGYGTRPPGVRETVTGKLTEEEAKSWVLTNLQELFALKPAPRGGGNNSVKRHLVEHLEFLRKRTEAGEISQSTFEVYTVVTRHFLKWFDENGYKKLSDIKRTSLQNYGIEQVSSETFSRSTAKLHIVYLRMWWKYLQETEVLERPQPSDP